MRKLARCIARAKIRPQYAVRVAHRIRLGSHLRLEQAVGPFGRHVDTGAARVEFPTVINAAESALFVATEEHRRAPVRAKGVDQADAAVTRTERDEVLAEQPDADRRAVFLPELLAQQKREPEAAHKRTHRRPWTGLREELVLGLAEHRFPGFDEVGALRFTNAGP